MDKTLVLVDSSFQNFKLNSRLKTDYVYITHNPPISVEKINENLSAALLVIGADNSDRFVDSFKKQSLQVNKHFYTLKRNKALNLTID